MSKSDEELRQMILNRRARFIAAAMCTSGVVFSACGKGSSDPIVGTIGETTTTGATTTASSSPTPCLTPEAPPTACLGVPVPAACLSIIFPSPSGTPSDTATASTAPIDTAPIDTAPIDTTPIDTEPRVCLSPPYPVEPVPTVVVESTSAPLDAGLDAAAVETEVAVTDVAQNSDGSNNDTASPAGSADVTEPGGAGQAASVEPASIP